MRPMTTNIVLLGSAVVLTGLAWLVVQSESRTFTKVEDIPRLFEGFTAENVRFVRLSQPKKADAEPKKPEPQEPKDGDKKPAAPRDELILVKRDTRWEIAEGDLKGVPVQANKVETDLFKHVRDIRVNKKLVRKDSSDPYLQEKGLADDQALLIECFDANQAPLVDLLQGKDASGGKWEDVTRGYFVRKKTSRDVVVYETDYWVLSLKADDWADKKIHEFEQGKIKSLAVRNLKGEVAFAKDKATDTEWKATKKPDGVGAVRQQEVNNIVSRFMRVDAARFLGPLAQHDAEMGKLGFTPGDFEITATVEDGTATKTYRMLIGKKIADKAEYYAKAEGCVFLFALPDWAVSSYEKDPKDLFDPAAPASQPSSAPASQNATGSQPAGNGEKRNG